LKFAQKHYELESKFGIQTIIRIICNIFIPGSGIFSLLCKFGCHVGIVFIGLSQVASGIYIYSFFVSLILKLKTDEEDMYILIAYFFSKYIAGILIIFFQTILQKGQQNMIVLLFFH